MFLGVFAMAVLGFFTRALCLGWWTSHVLSFSLKRVISLVGDDYKHLWLFHSDGNETVCFGCFDCDQLEILILFK